MGLCLYVINNEFHAPADAPEIWENDKQENDKKTPIEKYFTLKFHISDYTTLFSISKYNFTDLFDKGYDDAKNNKHFLDNILL